MIRWIGNLGPLVLIIAVGFVARSPLFVFSQQAFRAVSPCSIPVTYGIGTIDPRFGVSAADVRDAAREAERIWESASNRNLFSHASGTPVVTISLQYDLRQETTETLKDLGREISGGIAAYEALEQEYEAKKTQYLSQKTSFESESAAFERDARAYQRDVDSWNDRGGAPQSVVTRLNAQKAHLQERRDALLAAQNRVNALAEAVNDLARRLNAMAHDLNITTRTYNEVGSQTGHEYEEGVYESRAGKEAITVFEFDSKQRLARLLAHEFGHALGMDHVENVSSIMYRLNQSNNVNPTEEDEAELNRVCSGGASALLHKAGERIEARQ